MLKRVNIKKKKKKKKKRLEGIFVRENLKIIIVIKNVIWSEKTLMHKAVRPSNCFLQFFHI